MGEPIPPAGNGRDRVRPEQLAQRRDLHLQVVLLDDELRPDDVQQFVLRDHAIASLDERQQQVERQPGQLEGLLAALHALAADIDHEIAQPPDLASGSGNAVQEHPRAPNASGGVAC